MAPKKRITAEEAVKRIEKMMAQNAERQKRFMERKKVYGERRLHTYISFEAGEALEFERELTGLSFGQIISHLLIEKHKKRQRQIKRDTLKKEDLKKEYKSSNQVKRPMGRPKKSVKYPKLSTSEFEAISGIDIRLDYNKEAVEAWVTKLHSQGMGPTEIADRLNAQRVPLPRRKNQVDTWQRSTIYKMIKRNS